MVLSIVTKLQTIQSFTYTPEVLSKFSNYRNHQKYYKDCYLIKDRKYHHQFQYKFTQLYDSKSNNEFQINSQIARLNAVAGKLITMCFV